MNASGSLWGWRFQIHAGIKLMLDNIDDFKKLEMEGEHDDIEITSSDGEKIYAQAKAVLKKNDKSHISEKLSSALNTLANDVKSNPSAKKLIYITNLPYPMAQIKNKTKFMPEKEYAFKDLTTDEKQKIKGLTNRKIPEKKFKIQVIDVYAEDDSMTATAEKWLTNFLDGIGLRHANSSLLYYSWKEKLDFAGVNRKLDLSRERMMDSVIMLILYNPVGILGSYAQLFGEVQIDEAITSYQKHITKYDCLINRKVYDIGFFSGVHAEYEIETCKANSCPGVSEEGKIRMFAENNWHKFEGYFDDVEQNMREYVTKIAIVTTLEQAHKLCDVCGKLNISMNEVTK